MLSLARPLSTQSTANYIDELDQLRELRKARDSQYLDMSNRLGMEQIRAVRCTTCGAEAGEKCELNPGQPRTAPHRDRRLAAADAAFEVGSAFIVRL